MTDPMLPPRDEIAAEELVLAHVRIALRRRVLSARAACDAAVARDADPDPDQRALAETHGPGLLALLDGPTRDAVFQAAPPLRALVESVTAGAGDAVPFDPAQFEFAAVQSNKITDLKAQRYVQKLKTNTQNERATAAALMSEAGAFAAAQLLAPPAQVPVAPPPPPEPTEPEPPEPSAEEDFEQADAHLTAEVFAEPQATPEPIAKPQAAPEPDPAPAPEPAPVAEVLPEPAPAPEAEVLAPTEPVPTVDAPPEPEAPAPSEPVPDVPEGGAPVEAQQPEVSEAAPPAEVATEQPAPEAPAPADEPAVEPPDSKTIAPHGE